MRRRRTRHRRPEKPHERCDPRRAAAAPGAARHHEGVSGRARQRPGRASRWRTGEIHALLGENGAGKSTLVKIIYGVLHADEGAMLWQGEPVRIADPHAARGLGIGMVFQHFSLFEAMTVLENIALGVDDAGDMRRLARRIVEVSHAYGLPLDPAREVHTLSVGERQRIEIVRCLLQNPKLLIMDEPTSVLTPQEVERLFETLRQLAAEGCSILYISHKLDEIKALCDCATILRGGKVVATCDPKAETAKSMAQLMIGERAAHGRAARGRGPRRAPARGAQPRPAGRRAVRHDAEGPVLRGPPRRDLRHRGRRRQRPERAVPGALRRAAGRGRRHGAARRSPGRAHRCRRPPPARPLLRARGAQRPRAPCRTCRWPRTRC